MNKSIKSRPIIFTGHSVRAILGGTKTMTRRIMKPQPSNEEGYRCPYGGPGDRLWVKETYSTSGLTKYHHTGDPDDHGGPNNPCCAYASTATYKCGKNVPSQALAMGSHKWRSPMFMPRKMCRLTLEITGVKIERVQDISEADAIAEGCEFQAGILPEEQYAAIWDALNGKKPGCSWESNPYVWCVAFRKVERTACEGEER